VRIWKSLLTAAHTEASPSGTPGSQQLGATLLFGGHRLIRRDVPGAGWPFGTERAPRARALRVPRSHGFSSRQHPGSYPARIYSSLNRSPMTLLIRETDESDAVYCALRMSDKSGRRRLGEQSGGRGKGRGGKSGIVGKYMRFWW